MQESNRKIYLLQIGVWLLISLIMFLSLLQYDSVFQSAVYTVMSMSVYVLIIYSNAFWLIPRYFKLKRYFSYTLAVILLLVLAIFIRTYLTLQVYNYWFAKTPEVWKVSMLLSSGFSMLLIFIVSIIFRLAMDYFKLSRAQEQIKAEKAAVELSLLKQQLHPHFLFNTLNNIYFVVQKESPESAHLLERLSDIMRYFIEESGKEKVLLKDEIHLIKSYIELERIRMLNTLNIDFKLQGAIETTMLPPLLLMPIIENIFKHGIDKKAFQNTITVELNCINGYLELLTVNKLFASVKPNYKGGLGLQNLRKRLELYYSKDYELNYELVNETFSLKLKIPVYDF
jgi:sensor histidine kinase YesM